MKKSFVALGALVITAVIYGQFPKYSTGGSSGSSPGGGITDINGESGPSITIAAGTAGSDFAVTEAGNTVTINCPTSQPTIRGCLAGADFNNFYQKALPLHWGSSTAVGAGTVYCGDLLLNCGSTENQRQFPAPISGTLTRLYANNLSAVGAGGNLVITVRINGVSSSKTITYLANDPIGTVRTDTTNLPTVNAGDLISMQVVNSSGGTVFLTGTVLIRP